MRITVLTAMLLSPIVGLAEGSTLADRFVSHALERCAMPLAAGEPGQSAGLSPTVTRDPQGQQSEVWTEDNLLFLRLDQLGPWHGCSIFVGGRAHTPKLVAEVERIWRTRFGEEGFGLGSGPVVDCVDDHGTIVVTFASAEPNPNELYVISALFVFEGNGPLMAAVVEQPERPDGVAEGKCV
ncbi:MAG: hypothetical protein AAFT19_08495 [Pseudomonadota bacterium]